jgi:pimeloyl-ACP methyl ester carboxylesterase
MILNEKQKPFVSVAPKPPSITVFVTCLQEENAMTVPTRNILIFALFFLFVTGNESIFAQIRPPTVQDAIDSRTSPYVRNQEQRNAEEFARQRAWEDEQRRMEEERRRRAEAEARRQEEAIRNRPSTQRRAENAGFQSPVGLNQVLEALQPGDSIELHGDLFTAFDGMILSATYYRGANGKDSVPIVLLHGRGGSRGDFDPILPALLKEGMAVLVPDIRGHGRSMEFVVEEFGNPFPRYYPEFPMQQIPENPFSRTWLPDRWAEYQRMSTDVEAGRYQKPPTKISVKRYDNYDERDLRLRGYDLQVWQNFLINENNQERLNIKKLNLVGVEMGAGLVLQWGRFDSARVKTMTLISPVIPVDSMEAGQGNALNPAYLTNSAVRNTLSTMIIYGNGNERFKTDAEKVKETLLGRGKVDNEPLLKAKYPLIPCNTAKQGRDLFSLTSAQIDRGIPAFINDRLGKLEAAAAEKRNDTSLVWARAGNWNVKPAPPAERSTRTTSTTRPTGNTNVTTPTGATHAANRQN